MNGDVLIVDRDHEKAANGVVDLIIEDIKQSKDIFIITIAGESGAGKSEVAHSISKRLENDGISCMIFGQDDYFVYPPKTNLIKRREDASGVGMQEVRLDLLNKNIERVRDKEINITKPLIDFDKDEIGEEIVGLKNVKVLIIEGTYTSTLNNIDCRVFIDRSIFDTVDSRKKRARERQDEFLEEVLRIEHGIISKQKSLCDIVITRDFDVKKGNS